MSEAVLSPVRRFVTDSQDIADGYVEHRVNLIGCGLRRVDVTASQNADPGEDHLVKVNNGSDSNESVPLVDGQTLTIQLSDSIPDRFTIRKLYIKAGKDGTAFTVFGVG